MRLADDQLLVVRLRWAPDDEQPVGRLAWRQRRAWFQHDPDFLASGLRLSPFHLPLRGGVIQAPPSPFGGLFGVFDDSLPDGWGRLLMDRRARAAGLDPAALTPLDRLAWVGHTGLGALAYRPAFQDGDVHGPVHLDALAEQTQRVLAGTADEALAELQRLGGSPHGARPKALLRLRPDDLHISSAPEAGHQPVLVKFRASVDAADAGAVEYAYSVLARKAGLELPETWLLPSEQGPGWFAVARFDLDQGRRRHLHSLCGLLHADHRLPSLDYVGALAAVHRMTGDQRQVEQLVRRMVFNVLAHNRDDHTRQISLCMDREGCWTLAPAYDLTFAPGPGGEHCMAVAGAGRPRQDDLVRAAKQAGVAPGDTRTIIDQVSEALSHWPEVARQAGVQPRRVSEIWRALETISARHA